MATETSRRGGRSERWARYDPHLLGIGLMVRGGLFISQPEVLLDFLKRTNSWFLPLAVSQYVVAAHLCGGILLALGLGTRLAAAAQIPPLIAPCCSSTSRRATHGRAVARICDVGGWPCSARSRSSAQVAFRSTRGWPSATPRCNAPPTASWSQALPRETDEEHSHAHATPEGCVVAAARFARQRASAFMPAGRYTGRAWSRCRFGVCVRS